MKFSVTFVCVFVFLLAAGYFFYFDREISALSPAPAKALTSGPVIAGPEPAPERLLALGPEEKITAIEVFYPDKSQTFRLELRKDRWFITKPVVSLAEKILSDGLAAALALSVKERRLTREKDWIEYGLDKPVLKVSVQTDRHRGARTLDFGGESPVGGFLYARWEDDDEKYFLVQPDLKKAFDRSLYSMRQKTILNTDMNLVTKIFIRTGKTAYEIDKEGDEWFWLEPISILGERVASEHAGRILTELHDLSVKEFLDDAKEDKKAAGIFETGPVIKISKGASDSEMLFLGKEFPRRDAYYAAHDSDPVLFLVARGNIQRLFETVETMVDEAVLRAKPAVPASSPEEAEAPAEAEVAASAASES